MFTQRKRKLLKKPYLIVGLLMVFTSVAFTNCGQPGELELVQSEEDGPSFQSIPDIPDPGPNPNPNFVAKESSVIVDDNRSEKVDVLIVIDNSGSMGTEQKNMAQRFSSFIDKLKGLDWQLGIVTTDVSEDKDLKDGRLITFDGMNGHRVLTSSMNESQVKTSFGKTIQRKEKGSANEQGIRASYRAVQRTQENGSVNDFNRQLFRSDAALSIIVVTDADETPANNVYGVMNNGENLVALIKSLWPQKSFNFHSIVVPSGDAECKKKDGNESYGARYEALSMLTNGIMGTVCAQDYSAQLSLIGQKTSDLTKKSMSLACLPADTNGDGKPDIEVRDANNQLITGFTVTGTEVKFNNPLPIGKTTARYYCLQ